MRLLFFCFFSFVTRLLFSFEGFPEDKHKILVLQKCVLCHSPKLVSSQTMSLKKWDKTLLWMQMNHNLKFENKLERDKILEYLSKYFGETSSEDFLPMGRRTANSLPL